MNWRTVFTWVAACGVSMGIYGNDGADTFRTLAEKQEAKLEAALSRLREKREEIKNEQIPLAREFGSLERELEGLRRDLSRKQAARDSRSIDLDTLAGEVDILNKTYDYITKALFGELMANFEAALSVGEKDTVGELLRERNLVLDNREASEAQKLESSLEIVETALDRLETTLGGQVYEGKALSLDGRQIAGNFAQIGPVLYFQASGEALASWVEETPDLRAKLAPMSDENANAIAAFFETNAGELPIDPTLGNALALGQTRDSLWVHLKKGGIWVAPIMVFALVATVVALIKFAQIYRIRRPDALAAHDILRALRSGDAEQARQIAQRQPEPSAGLLLAAVEHSDESVELVEEVMYESMLNTQPKLESYLNVIAVTAAIAPLLGLLGTVTGIIKTFKLMDVFGAGDPKPLISGISEALITTELGLVLAIPALVAHALLSRKVAGVMSHLEKLSVGFVNGLSRSKEMGAKQDA